MNADTLSRMFGEEKLPSLTTTFGQHIRGGGGDVMEQPLT